MDLAFYDHQIVRKSSSISSIPEHVLARGFVLLSSGTHYAMTVCSSNKHFNRLDALYLLQATRSIIDKVSVVYPYGC